MGFTRTCLTIGICFFPNAIYSASTLEREWLIDEVTCSTINTIQLNLWWGTRAHADHKFKQGPVKCMWVWQEVSLIHFVWICPAQVILIYSFYTYTCLLLILLLSVAVVFEVHHELLTVLSVLSFHLSNNKCYFTCCTLLTRWSKSFSFNSGCVKWLL